MGNDESITSDIDRSLAEVEGLRIAICQPEIVQGNWKAQRAAINAQLAEARAQHADFAVAPDLFGITGKAFVFALGDTKEEKMSPSAVLLDIRGRKLVVGLEKGMKDCGLLALDDTQRFTLSGRKNVARGVPQVVVKPAGMTNYGKVVSCYQGESRLVTPSGRVCACLRNDFQPEVRTVSFTEDDIALDAPRTHLLQALESTIARFDATVMPWRPKWVIGLSGGLDSSIVAALLVRALGPERVIGYNLATRFNSQATKGNAASLARALGIELKNGSIEELVTATDATLAAYGYDPESQPSLVRENVQARLRGHMLSTFAAIEGGVVANNGNRIESALGYATLYGDSIGALAPIADLTKVQLFDLAREINGEVGCEVIPENLLPIETEEGLEWQTMPSAELSDGQHDPMKWYYHDWLVPLLSENPPHVLEDIVNAYREDQLASYGMDKWIRFYGLTNPQAFIDDLEWVVGSMHRAAFKRIQACPAIRVASLVASDQRDEVQGPLVLPRGYEAARDQLLRR